MGSRLIAVSVIILIVILCVSCSEGKSNPSPGSINGLSKDEQVRKANNDKLHETTGLPERNDSPVFQEENSNAASLVSLKEEVGKVHVGNFKYLIQGDAKTLAKAFSQNYTEFNEDYIKEKARLDEGYFNRYFSSESYKEYKGKSIDELINIQAKAIFLYDEMKDKPHNEFDKYKDIFNFTEGDILIQYPPKKDSPMFFMWNAYYRKENGEWKIIASNFWSINFGLYNIK